MKDLIIRFLFERLPVLNLLNGYKTLIGRVLLALGAVLSVLAIQFPEYAIIGEINAHLVMLIGWLGLEAGVQHANVKAKK